MIDIFEHSNVASTRLDHDVEPFPLRAHQQMVTDLENTRRVLGLMRKALGAMARSSRDAELGKDFFALDPRARMASLLAPTDVFVTELRRAVKTRLGRAGDDLVTGSGRWSSRAASARSSFSA